MGANFQNPFKNSNETLIKIKNAITQALKEEANPYAAFDADGTLWATDAGDIFFQYLIDKKFPPLPDNPWEYYLTKKAHDPKAAYLWLAQIFKGYSLNEVQTWAQEAFEKASPLPTFEVQKEIIHELQKNNVEIFIVTASIKWAVEPYAQIYNIPKENVIGVETKVINNKSTDEQLGPITYRSGKVEGFKTKVENFPFYVSGNTLGDLDLMKYSSHIRVAICSSMPDDEIYKSETQLLNKAQEESWFYFER